MGNKTMTHDPYLHSLQFEHLCSGAGTWRMQLIDCDTKRVIQEQTCLPVETSKLYCWSGSEVADLIQQAGQVYALQALNTVPASKTIQLRVRPCPNTTVSAPSQTWAQQIIAEDLPSNLKTPVQEIAAFIQLNDHLFETDPASLIVLVGEDQYDEYDYLAAQMLLELQQGVHPEYILRTLFDCVGLGGRYSEDAIDTTLNTISKILRSPLETTAALTDELHQRPDSFIYSILVHPQIAHAAQSFPDDESRTDYWNDAISVSRQLIAGTPVVDAVKTIAFVPRCLETEEDNETLEYFIDQVARAVYKANILKKTRTMNALLNPEPGCFSRFDTRLRTIRKKDVA